MTNIEASLGSISHPPSNMASESSLHHARCRVDHMLSACLDDFLVPLIFRAQKLKELREMQARGKSDSPLLTIQCSCCLGLPARDLSKQKHHLYGLASFVSNRKDVHVDPSSIEAAWNSSCSFVKTDKKIDENSCLESISKENTILPDCCA